VRPVFFLPSTCLFKRRDTERALAAWGLIAPYAGKNVTMHRERQREREREREREESIDPVEGIIEGALDLIRLVFRKSDFLFASLKKEKGLLFFLLFVRRSVPQLTLQ